MRSRSAPALSTTAPPAPARAPPTGAASGWWAWTSTPPVRPPLLLFFCSSLFELLEGHGAWGLRAALSPQTGCVSWGDETPRPTPALPLFSKRQMWWGPRARTWLGCAAACRPRSRCPPPSPCPSALSSRRCRWGAGAHARACLHSAHWRLLSCQSARSGSRRPGCHYLSQLTPLPPPHTHTTTTTTTQAPGQPRAGGQAGSGGGGGGPP